MFVSRGTRDDTRESSKLRVVLVETETGSELDKCVIPAVVEHIVGEASSVFSRHGSVAVMTAILAIDRSPHEFSHLCRRRSIPFSNVIDGYSDWYGGHHVSTAGSERDEKKGRIVHVGDIGPAASGSVGKEIMMVLGSAGVASMNERIVVVDSMTSFLRLRPGIKSVLDLISCLQETGAEEKLRFGRSTTLIMTYRDVLPDKSLLPRLKRLADTHVLVRQIISEVKGVMDGGEGKEHAIRNTVSLSICRRKASGRVQLEDIAGKLDWDNYEIRDIINSNAMSEADRKGRDKNEEEKQQARMLAELGLSFRVTLSTKEKELRSAVGLPYLHRDEKLADSALELHPQHLQVGAQRKIQKDLSESDEDDYDSDGEEIFSEDV